MKKGVSRTMVTGMNVPDLFDLAMVKKKLVVNRHYQRKLVWTLEEKKSFVDSLMKGYPVPLILFARNKVTGNLEIVDGLQRLDAIVSFIMNEFSVKWDGKNYYCNTFLFATKDLPIRQKKPALPREGCMFLQRCQLPVTIIDSEDEETIIEIFERINSTGRKLSQHDLRQAGSTNEFSTLVRKVSASIRGDETFSDVLQFGEMRGVSLNNRGMNYGIKMKDVFWIKHDIISPKEIRSSRDEEVIAQIFSYVLLGKNSEINSETLDQLYDHSSEKNQLATKQLRVLGQVVVGDQILKIHNQIEKICKCSGRTFTSLLFEKRRIRGKSKIYVSLALAIWELKRQGFEIVDYEKAAMVLQDSGDNKKLSRITETNNWDTGIRKKAINYFISILKPICIEKNDYCAFSGIRLSEILRVLDRVSEVGIETQMVEFKMGITTLDQDTLNKSVIKSSIKSLVAMVNTDLERTGYVVFGLADSKQSAIDFEKHYGVEVAGFGNCLIAGVDEEVKRYYGGSFDKYLQRIKEVVERIDTQESVKREVLSNIGIVKVCKKSLVILQLKNQGKPAYYGHRLWIRSGNCNQKIKSKSEFELDFLKEKWGLTWEDWDEIERD